MMCVARKPMRSALAILRVAGLACVLAALPVLGRSQTDASTSLEIPEELQHDPALPRDEQIRRHKERLKLLIEHHQARAKERMEERAEERIDAVQSQRNQANADRTGGTVPEVPRASEMTANAANANRAAAGRTGRPSGTTPAPGTGASGGGGKTAFPTSKAIAYITPFQTATQVGRFFETDVELMNNTGRGFDTVAIHLNYDPLVMEPVQVNDAPLHKRSTGNATLSVNRSRGRLSYFATLKEPYAPTTTTLITVLWKALNPILYSEIQMEAGPNGTLIGLDRRNLLGYSAAGRHEGGTLPGAVIVAPENDSPRTLMPPFGDVALTGIDEKVHLRLEAESESVAAGQEWIVGVVLRNDATLPFNNLRFRILFDPTKLQVVDWHQGNWIRHGRNIYDGFAHEQYPFEVHFENSADNERGTIVYHVGTQEARFFPTGELARIKFEALTDASLEDVRFDFQIPRIADESETDVQFLGASVFRDRKVEGEAAKRPAPPPLKRPGT